MSRNFKIAQAMEVAVVIGLQPPVRRRQAHVLLWTVDGKRRPDYLRWCWHPVTGHLLVGVVHRHAELIGADMPPKPFVSYLRGFVFSRERMVAIRPFWWPKDEYEHFDPEQDRVVGASCVSLLTPHLRRYRFICGIDNRWLVQTFSKYGSSW